MNGEKIEGLEVGFKLKGTKIRMIKGVYKGMKGEIIKETDYCGYGVVCKIKLENGKIVEYSHDFWEELS